MRDHDGSGPLRAPRPALGGEPPWGVEPPPPPFDRAIQNRLCHQLRSLYAALAPAPLPAHMKGLLDRLESEKDGSSA